MEQPFQVKFSNGNVAQTIKIHNTSDIIPSLLKIDLKIGVPTIVLIGGAAGLSDDELNQLHPFFVEILAPFMDSSAVNVIDGGTDAGIMQLMGQARAEIDATFPLVGVAAEGTITLPDDEKLNPKVASLEAHHTHFILVPGNDWGDESPWLDRVTTALSNEKPSATILINGGEISRRDVAHSLAAHRPVIVFAGTGRLADELASIKKHSSLIHTINITDPTNKIIHLLTHFLKGAKQ